MHVTCATPYLPSQPLQQLLPHWLSATATAVTAGISPCIAACWWIEDLGSARLHAEGGGGLCCRQQLDAGGLNKAQLLSCETLVERHELD
jgi:hypothetical protein